MDCNRELVGIFLLLILVWECNGERKMGPCPEKWLPLLLEGKPDITVIKKCMVHVEFTTAASNLKQVSQECSNILGNANVSRLFHPENDKEIHNFNLLAQNISLHGFYDVVFKSNQLYDHVGNAHLYLANFLAAVIAAGNAQDDHCAFNDPGKQSNVEFRNCDSVGKFWCEYPAKSVLMDYSCDGWFKADAGNRVYCYIVHRLRTTSRRAHHICRTEDAHLVTFSSVTEWMYVTRLTKAIASRSFYRPLLLGYIRDENAVWRTIDGHHQIIDKINIEQIENDQFCVELNQEEEVENDALKLQGAAIKGGKLQSTYCHRYVDYFICKKLAVGYGQ